jgi:ADP-L-glycero-D-manno-heptose 6-epimerase
VSLRGRNQSWTEADITALRKAGYAAPFLSVEEGVPRYLTWLEELPA